MKQCFRDHFNVVSPMLENSLMSPHNICETGKLCALFPFDTAKSFGFEARLGKKESECDFFIQIGKDSLGAKILAGENPLSKLSPLLLNDRFWKRMEQLFKAWLNSNHFLSKMIKGFWLEFDCIDGSYNLIPNVFFGMEENKGACRSEQWETRHRVLDEIYSILFDIPFPYAIAENLKMCILALPPNASLLQFGFMIPRKTEAIRLVLLNLELDEVETYLNNIGWTGEFEQVKRLIDRYFPFFNYIAYNIYIEENLLPILGMEMYFLNRHLPRFDDQWNRAFDLLESDKLLLHEKRKSLTNFCGLDTVSYMHTVQYVRGINHLKLVYRRDAHAECKGYFGSKIE